MTRTLTRAAPLLLAGLAIVGAVAAGPTAFAKLAYRAGLIELALPFIENEAARGAALYRLGRYEEADAVFAKVGRSATYNRGLTLAATGRYKLATAYFDAVLFANRWDADARRNREIVAALVEPVIGEGDGHGRIATVLRSAGIDAAAFDPENPTAAAMPADRSTRKPTDARTVAATEEWLATLSDAPGEFLRKRLAAELDRRRAAGTAAPEEPSPW